MATATTDIMYATQKPGDLLTCLAKYCHCWYLSKPATWTPKIGFHYHQCPCVPPGGPRTGIPGPPLLPLVPKDWPTWCPFSSKASPQPSLTTTPKPTRNSYTPLCWLQRNYMETTLLPSPRIKAKAPHPNNTIDTSIEKSVFL